MAHPSTQTDFELDRVITSVINHYGNKPSALIMVLQDVQKHFRYLPIEALQLVAGKMSLPIAQIYGVATFYKAFSLKPKGKHHICVCTGTACHVRQANVIVDNMERALAIEPGQTTADGQLSFETVNCVGACALGPLVTVDETYYGNMTVSKMNDLLQKLNEKAPANPAAKEADA